MISPTSPSLRAVRRVSDMPRPAPESAIGRPLFEGALGDAEGQRVVGQDAGDEDSVIIE